MSGATVSKLSDRLDRIESGSKVRVTPELAMLMLDANKINRPLTQGHINRIASQITEGHWRFNGDTIKISEDEDILDGQHRLWAIVEAKIPVESIIVRGIKRDAFATIDTIRKPRSLGDTVAVAGNVRYRNVIGQALAWLIRWQGGYLEAYRSPKNKIENSDVERALKDNPAVVRAVERMMPLRRVGNTGILSFLYYVVANRNPDLAERMANTLLDPAGVSVSDPFFALRQYFIGDHHKQKDPVVTIACAFKALNCAAEGRKVGTLNWRNQGKAPEQFPKLKV